MGLRQGVLLLLVSFFIERCSCESDWEVLAKLFIASDGQNWLTKENWLTDFTTVCTWHGVKCDDDEQVIELKLQDNALRGTLPDHMFSMTALQLLDLRGNTGLAIDFSAIDEKPTGLRQLYMSDLAIDSLRGVGILDTLEVLVGRGLGLTGTVPSEVLAMTTLTTLDLASNFISGELPDAITDLSDLRNLFLTDNLISGTLSSSLGNLTNISQFAVDLNQLTGTLPSELSNLHSLTYFAANDQKMVEEGGLVGIMPDFSDAPFLYTLDVANNRITGTVPHTLLDAVDPTMGSFMNVDMSGNELVGMVPEELSRFGEIRIFLVQNAIEAIPVNLCFLDGWFSGEVGQFGCDAILCPPGTFSTFGRQISSGFPCAPCSVSSFYGSTSCDDAGNGTESRESMVHENGLSRLDNGVNNIESDEGSQDYDSDAIPEDFLHRTNEISASNHAEVLGANRLEESSPAMTLDWLSFAISSEVKSPATWVQPTYAGLVVAFLVAVLKC